MSEKKTPAWVENKRAMGRELTEAKRAAGIWRDNGFRNSYAEQGWRDQMEIDVPDTRNLTGQLLGDPIPGDPRAPWRGLSGN